MKDKLYVKLNKYPDGKIRPVFLLVTKEMLQYHKYPSKDYLHDAKFICEVEDNFTLSE